MKKIKLNVLYPSITNISSAKEAVKYGYASAAFMAGITTVNFLMKLFDSNSYDSVYIASVIIGDILPIAILGYFIFKMSRIASILALLLCLFELFNKYQSHGSVGMMPIFIVFYISAIRGTFLYQKFLLIDAVDIGDVKDKELL
jgi:hypothetical protein